MMIFGRIFDVFSRAPEASLAQAHDVPTSTRNRVLLWCDEVFSNSRSDHGTGDYRSEFWNQVHRFLQYRHGRVQLSRSSASPASPAEDALAFLINCSGDEFLDFVEYIFRVDCFFHVGLPEDQLVEELNELLRPDNLPYYVTHFVKETVREVATEYPLAGREVNTIKTVSYPKVIMRESEVLHSQAIAPALTLLQRPEFKSANSEYLEALEDYRKGDLGDCLTKCGSAFESVLKILCHRRGWPYQQTDTASTLVRTVLDNSSLDRYFESPLLIVATLRNRLSTSHGAGPNSKQVPEHLARYALNVTASAILLLVEEAGV